MMRIASRSLAAFSATRLEHVSWTHMMKRRGLANSSMVPELRALEKGGEAKDAYRSAMTRIPSAGRRK